MNTLQWLSKTARRLGLFSFFLPKVLVLCGENPIHYLKPVSPVNQAKNGHFQIFEVWTFVPAPYFGFWLFAWSRCGRIVKKSSRKDSWYQSDSILLTVSSPSCHQQPVSFVPQTAPNIWTQAVSILVERTINQKIEVFLFLPFLLNLDHFR